MLLRPSQIGKGQETTKGEERQRRIQRHQREKPQAVPGVHDGTQQQQSCKEVHEGVVRLEAVPSKVRGPHRQ